ncbi:MAG: hypothetical protein KDJ90_00490 [Nitratireductor sp.]|nr:hypothetical protein [Nitratireductor sp.]
MSDLLNKAVNDHIADGGFPTRPAYANSCRNDLIRRHMPAPLDICEVCGRGPCELGIPDHEPGRAA